MRDDARHSKGTSLAKGPAWFIGLALLALGITGLIFASTSFSASPINGDVTGSTWLTIAGNGWTWVLFAAAGLVLMLAAPMHWGAKSMAIIVGLVLGAASVISMVDGSDVFGIFAANGMTMLVWGVAAAALLIIGLLPRVGGKKDHRDERVVEREYDRERERAPMVEAERRPVERGTAERTGRFDRDRHDETVTDRHVESTGATAGTGRHEDVLRPEDHNETRRR